MVTDDVSRDRLRALIVDDDKLVSRTVERILVARGLDVHVAQAGSEALDVLERMPCDVVLSDLRLAEMSGLDLFEKIRERGAHSELMLMTGMLDEGVRTRARASGVYGILQKPFPRIDRFGTSVVNAACHARARASSVGDDPTSLPLYGTSPAIRAVQHLISGIAPSTSTVLVLGESGTGKELAARAIHKESRRAGRPLIALNCGAIPSELVESELFGHTRGAFTMAHASRGGLFEAADGGTLLLDEVGELPIHTQVKLLRTLQSGEIRAVGSDVTRKVDVRVIAATNRDLKSAVAKGTFRQDLYFRLKVFSVALPPLRERGDDIHFLANRFAQRYGTLWDRPAVRISEEAALAFEAYDWPGNVRELEHAVEHASVLSQGRGIELSNIPSEVADAYAAASEGKPRRSVIESGSDPKSAEGPLAALLSEWQLTDLPYPEAKRRVLETFDDAYASATLAAANGNVSEAARLSGLDRSNYRRLLRRRGRV